MANYFPSRLVIPVALALILTGCGEQSEVAPATRFSDEETASVELLTSALAADRAHAMILYVDALDVAVRGFLASPDDATASELKAAWITAHHYFTQARPFIRMVGQEDMLFQVDAWPMEPGFLDNLPEYPDSGIINDATLNISHETLMRQHGITDPLEVSLGFHPIEYYAFSRPIEDFIRPESDSFDFEPIERRRLVLSIVAKDLRSKVIGIGTDIERIAADDAIARASGYFSIDAILQATRMTAHDGFQQASLIVDSDQGHCEYSQTSLATLGDEVAMLRQIYAEDAVITALLQKLDINAAQNLQSTLAQATAVFSNETISETDRVKLPLMLSAIGHQLEDLLHKRQHPN